jgi:PAS domain S-box-containing protein
MRGRSTAKENVRNRAQELEQQVIDLKSRLDEAREVLRAIRGGEVDAVLVSTPDGDRTFTLEGADHPYRVFIENIAEGAVTVTPEGTVLYCNSRFARIAQQPRGNIIGSSFYNFVSREHRVALTTLLRQASNKEIKSEVNLETGEGLSIPVQLSVSNISLQGSDVRCVLVTDFTEQRMNRQIIAHERITSSIFDQVTEALVVVDFMGKIIRANNKANILAGRDVLYTDFQKSFALSCINEPSTPFSLLEVFDGKSIVDAEVMLNITGSNQFSLIVSATPLFNSDRSVIGGLVTLYDITGRKKAEERIKWLSSFPERNPNPIVEIDPSGNITYANEAAKMIFPDLTASGGKHPFLSGIQSILNEQKNDVKRGFENEILIGDRWFHQTSYYTDVFKRFRVYGVDVTERKKMEEKLQISMQRFYSILSNMQSGILLVSDESRVEFANQAFCDTFGLKDSPSDLWNLYQSEVLEKIRPVYIDSDLALARIKEIVKLGQPVRGEDVGMKDGRTFLRDFIPISLGKKSYGRLWVHTDITERKKAEDSLRVHQIELQAQNEELSRIKDDLQSAKDKYLDLYDFAPIGYFTLDESGIIKRVNLRGSKMLGLEREKVIQRKFQLFICPEDREMFDGCLKKIFSSGEEQKGEFRLLRQDGSDFFGQLECVMASEKTANVCRILVQDITKRRKAEEALRESEERFRTMANAMPQLAWIAKADGYIFWYNQRWYEYSGTTPEQMEGWGWQSVHDPDALPGVMERWKSSIATGQPFYMEFPLRGADGIYRPFLTRGFPLKDNQGRVVQWFGTNTDVSELKKVEDALRESEQRLKFHFENSPLAVVEWDSDYIVTKWSAESERLFGWKREEVLGKRIDTLNMIYKDDIPIVDRTMQRLSSGKERIVVSSNRNYTKSGTVIECAWYNSVLLDGNGQMASVMSLVDDITERKNTEKALRESEERFRVIAETAPMLVCITRTADSKVLFVNEYNNRAFGRRREDIINSIGPDYYWDPSDRVKMVDMFNKQGYVDNYQVKVKKSDGTPFWIMTSVRPIIYQGQPAMIGASIDITENKRIEEALNDLAKKLEEEKNKLNLIIEKAQVGIIFVDKEGRTVLTNPVADDILGYKVPENAGLEDQSVMPVFLDAEGNPYSSFRELPLTRSVFEGETFVDYEMIVVRGSDKRNLLVNTAPVRDAGGNVAGAIGIFRDVTDLKSAEAVLRRDKDILEQLANKRTRELLKAHAELEHTKRMSDIGRLSATVAHELRNPLSAIRAAAYNIEKKAKNPLLASHLKTINNKVLESDQIIQNLLSFSRVKAVTKECLNISAIIRDCIETVSEKYAGWEVKLKEKVNCREDDIIEADQYQFKMLLCNILDNAYQALPDKKGTVGITVRKHKNELWEISVSDSGTGIDKQDMEKLFEPFYTTKSRGTGLGLPVCREIVGMHQGNIGVKSAKGKGSTFTVTLPIRNQPTNQPELGSK